MSDGLSDCAADGQRRAARFVKRHFPNVEILKFGANVPEKGTVLVIYEEWLDHVVELVENRLLKERWLIPCISDYKPVKIKIHEYDWQVEYYRIHHQIECKDKLLKERRKDK